MTNGTNVKVLSDAHSLLEFYLGIERSHGKSVDKQVIASEMLVKGLRSTMSPEMLALYEKGKSHKAKLARNSVKITS